MSSGWGPEIVAVFRKEALAEMRTKSGLLTAGLFSALTVITLAFASFGSVLAANVSAGLLWVALVFASIVALPRAFVSEEEQGTADLLRLIARPHAVFWGKSLFNLAQMLITALALSLLYAGLTDQAVRGAGLFLLSLGGGSAALAGAVTLCGAFVAKAANRAALAGVISLPLLLPLVALGIGAIAGALGGSPVGGPGWSEAAGLWLYAVAVFAVGPHLFAAIWKT
jgi:heme exporter protein B